MRLKAPAAVLAALLLLAGCHPRFTPPEQPMPPKTILLSAMMRELSAQPGFTETLLAELEGVKPGDTRKGPALLTPALVNELRKRILGKDWGGLDRFPGWTMRAINPTVDVAGHVLADDSKANPRFSDADAIPSLTAGQLKTFLDLGPFAPGLASQVSAGQVPAVQASLDTPSALPPFTTEGLVTDLGYGVTRGDGPGPRAAEHPASQRLADVLNRLAAAASGDAQPFSVEVGGRMASTPEGLIEALGAEGCQVTVTDSRYFANFGHLHFRQAGTGPALDVMMPFWVDTQIAVPDERGWLHRLLFRPRPLLVPVSHAEYEWHIRAPENGAVSASELNADISYYFGIDGKSEWRTMDTLDQPWVLKRNAHTYTGTQAVEVTRLAGLFTVAMLHQHARRPGLPFGGYYALGVCQDGVSAIEQKLTGHVTLFPNTADSSLFDDPRDAEVNRMMQAIPKDRAGAMPEPARVFGSLPAAPGQDGSFAAITIPGLADDLHLTYTAWQKGSLGRTHGGLFYWAWSFAVAAGGAGLAALLLRRRWSRPE